MKRNPRSGPAGHGAGEMAGTRVRRPRATVLEAGGGGGSFGGRLIGVFLRAVDMRPARGL